VCKCAALLEHVGELHHVAVFAGRLEQAVKMVVHEAVHDSFKPIITRGTQKCRSRAVGGRGRGELVTPEFHANRQEKTPESQVALARQSLGR
jgi:hypothetical protein